MTNLTEKPEFNRMRLLRCIVPKDFYSGDIVLTIICNDFELQSTGLDHDDFENDSMDQSVDDIDEVEVMAVTKREQVILTSNGRHSLDHSL